MLYTLRCERELGKGTKGGMRTFEIAVPALKRQT